MNLVDLGIVLLAVALAAVGYERGLVASALPLAGFLGGAALGGRIGPALLPHGAESQYAPIVAVATGVLIGAFAAVALDGVAQALRARALGGSAGVADGVGGAIVLAALALALCWAFGAVALNALMPPSGPLLHVLRRVDPTPVVRGPEADVPPADPGSADDPEVRAAGDSTVRVLGTACGLGVEGSGWVAAEGVVVTNAHVVAGEDDTTVTPDGGSALDATVVHYDIRNDLAILGAPGLEAAALDLAASTPKGADAAVIGYPDNGPLAFTPARLGRTGTVASQDSYGRGPVQRKMTPFRAAVRSGNSGGPVVDTAGDVLSTVFAATVGGGADSGLGVPNSVVRRALSERLAPADTGPCAA